MTLITSPQNATVKAARKLTGRRGRARAAGAVLVEGPEVLRAAAAALEQVFLAETADAVARAAAEAAAARGVPVARVTPSVLATLADTTTPRGVVGVARLERPAAAEVLAGARLTLLCCDVADPGNLGTIIRTADAAGADAVLVTAGSVDPGNPKAVRASAGSLFHLPVLDGLAPLDALAAARAAGLRTVATDAAATVAHDETDLARPTMLVLGGEAHGLPAQVRERCDTTVAVPMRTTPRPGYAGVAESLNLAATAAVLAFEAARQRRARAGGRRGAA